MRPLTRPAAGAEYTRTILEQGLSPNTRRAYKKALEYFWAWAREALELTEHYPVAVDTVLRFVADHLGQMEKGLEQRLNAQGVKAAPGPNRLSTVRLRLAVLGIAHGLRGVDDPCKSKLVKRVLMAAARVPGARSQGKKAITADILMEMVATCRKSLLDIRDRALLLLAFSSGGRRRSEVAAFEVSDLTPVEGGYVLRLRRSKTDQSGEGVEVPVFGPAAQALAAWLKASRICDGRLFRGVTAAGTVTRGITGRQIARIVKNRLERAGHDPAEYSAHSLRSGFITESGRQGIHLGDAMALSGHRSLEMVLRYYRPGQVVNNPAARLLQPSTATVPRQRR